MFDCWVLAIFKANPSLDFRTPRMVEVDHADERGKRSRGMQGRHVAVIWGW
jgi:hypothetical protein